VTHRVHVVSRPRLSTVLRRALALRCPACGGTRLFARRFVMRPGCSACGLVHEAEQGYFVGAIYVNYALSVAVGLGSVLLLDALHPMSLAVELSLAIPLMVAVPLLFFHHARSLWLAIGYVATDLDRRAARRR